MLYPTVDPSQVAYIKGRFIGNNVRLVQDVFDLYNEKRFQGAILFADFTKAFDSIEWEFLFSTLSKFNFGEGFQKGLFGDVSEKGYLGGLRPPPA